MLSATAIKAFWVRTNIILRLSGFDAVDENFQARFNNARLHAAFATLCALKYRLLVFGRDCDVFINKCRLAKAKM